MAWQVSLVWRVLPFLFVLHFYACKTRQIYSKKYLSSEEGITEGELTKLNHLMLHL
jgi:hypothetical protein